MSTKQPQQKSTDPGRYEELISINDFGSADALKVEIRRRIASKENENWRFDTLDCRGAYIAVLFKQ